MANDFTGNPWKIDGATPVTITADAVRVKKVRWVGPIAPGHTAVITDTAGRTVWESRADIANDFIADDLIETSGPDDWKGVKIPTLNSGTLYITYY